MTRAARAGRALDPAVFRELRRTMELTCFKWDVQVGDTTALAPFPLLLDEATWAHLADLAERLTRETLAAEREILDRPALQRRISLPPALQRLFRRGAAARPTPSAARVMRFDFHFTTEGWRISEVNSDVPGGFTEATHFTALVAGFFPGTRATGDPTKRLVDALLGRARDEGAIALLSAPGFMEDHQVVTHLAKELRDCGAAAFCASPAHVRFHDGRAHLVSAGHSGPLGALVRFYQAEWLPRLPSAVDWEPLFVGGRTPVSNPGTAALSESKRLPLVWDELGARLDTWRRLLPETRDPRDAPWLRDDGWILKSAYGNTGDTVSMRPHMTALQWANLAFRVSLAPADWVAQRRFTTIPLETPLGPMLPCIGVYTVDGRAAGAYGRVTERPFIDAAATDVAVLIAEERP
ncbi:glutathionylspermidine synthase family protein [Polyangium sp. 15x6]|uniref:glutathionylspermidine synthase family protein n=1 Tax=Polyangium sp. 15x6 TaxID=3042687 RepID=UPI00249A3363|nr:glutathionylspermidine synthase family protein [Polyangium sp. 15x6]MDI3283904.1 glutathionylspermidine synthase family protein [Polyangium sp. 15x6]